MLQRTTITACLCLLMFSSIGAAQSKAKPMTDAELQNVTAGEVNADIKDGVIHFQGMSDTANGTVEGLGTITFQSAAIGNTIGNLLLSDNAQGNLRSFVNINAVNSNVNVLVNLTVNVNSTVGTLTQSNLNGRR